MRLSLRTCLLAASTIPLGWMLGAGERAGHAAGEATPAVGLVVAADVPRQAGATPTIVAPPVEVPPPTRAPIGHRVVKAPTIVYAGPDRRSGRRGRVTTRRPFEIYSVRPAADCAGEGWAELETGWACLEYAVASEGPARPQPELSDGRVLPFLYAKPRVLDRKTGEIFKVPRYRDLRAYRRDEPPTGFLEPDREYLFTRSKQHGRSVLLFDLDDRVVPARGLKIAPESRFSGRDLARAPIPAGLHAAWAVSRPSPLRARPEAAAPVVGQRAYQAAFDVDPRPIVVGEATWFAVPDGAGPGVPAYVHHEDVNHWIPGAPLEQAGPGELWIDVELGQQTLAVMRGAEPEFVTLISSGASGSNTPRGLFRVHEKLAVWTMRSSPTAADPYFVEGVPWIQYFHRRFALHAAYWHDGFGKRRSHGCINLSPRDAAHVFALTTPRVPPGWNALVEHAGDPGTLVRIRKGTDPVPDLRAPLGAIDAGAEDDAELDAGF